MDHYDSRSTSQVLYTVLDRCVEDVLTLIKPLESDRNLRLNAIAEIVSSVQSIETLKGAAVKPFGSFVSNLYSKWGDLDISITLDQHFNSCASRKKKQSVLREIMKTLRKRGIGRKIQFIPQARVPLLVYESSLYGISCDVSVDNHQGRVKSKILQHITSFDERFADMVLLIKEWAKTHSINNPKTGTLNSYSLCLLVIFHLQTCKPAILPPLKEIYDGNICDDVEGVDTEREREIDDICGLNVQKIISHISRHRNESSLADLLVSFFDKFSEIEALSSEYVICTFTGRWERMASNTRWTEKSYCIYIEDPFEQPDNAARAVGSHNLSTIAGVVRMTRQLLSSSSVLSDRKSLLHLLCRPLVSSLLSAPIYTHRQANIHQYPNMTGNQQSPEHVGYCVSAFAESSLNQDRTTKIRSTGKVYADPNQSTHLANGNQQSPDCVGYCVSAFAESSLNLDRTTKIRTTGKVYAGHSTHLDNGSNSSQRSKRNEKSVYYGSSFRVAEDQVHEPNLNHNYRIGRSDLNHLSQPANGTSQSNLREESAEYVPSIQIAKYSQDSKLTNNHRNRQAHYSAQRMDRTSQDHVVNLNESRRIRSEIVDPKHDNMTRNYINNQMRFAGRTPGRFDQHHNSGSNGGHKTGMTNGEPSIGPSMIRSHQSHPLVRYSTTPTGSMDQDIDASINRNRIHRPGLAIVEPVPEQLNHNLNLNGSSFRYRSNKGKQIWQPKFASNQVFQ